LPGVCVYIECGSRKSASGWVMRPRAAKFALRSPATRTSPTKAKTPPTPRVRSLACWNKDQRLARYYPACRLSIQFPFSKYIPPTAKNKIFLFGKFNAFFQIIATYCFEMCGWNKIYIFMSLCQWNFCFYFRKFNFCILDKSWSVNFTEIFIRKCGKFLNACKIMIVFRRVNHTIKILRCMRLLSVRDFIHHQLWTPKRLFSCSFDYHYGNF